MINKTVIKKRLEYWSDVYEKLQEAYVELIEGRVKSYKIDDRELTRFDLKDIAKQLEEIEQKIEEYEALLAGKRVRKAVGVIPRDY